MFVLIFGTMQLVVWLAFDFYRSQDLRARQDREIAVRAEAIAGLIEERLEDGAAPDSLAEIAPFLPPFDRPAGYYELRDEHGVIRLQSPSLLTGNLPAPPRTPANEVVFRTLREERADDSALAGRTLRIGSLFRQPANKPSFAVQVAEDLTPVEAAVWRNRNTLILFTLVSLVLAGVAAWLVTRRSLLVLSEVAAQARRLDVRRLSERLPMRRDDEVGALVTDLNTMLARLERDFQRQQRFISDVTHELKTPLAVLLGEIRLLKRQSPETRDYGGFVKLSEDELSRLLRVVEGFLIITRARTAQAPRVRDALAVDDLLLRAVRTAEPAAAAASVRIVPRIGDASDERDEPIVHGDGDLLGAMLNNLLANAIEHSPAGSVIDVGLERDNGAVAIGVRDHGPGIPESERSRIFEMFVRGADDVGRPGLGLSVARAVAELHGGEIVVTDPPDARGALFIVRLPTGEYAAPSARTA